MLDNFYKCLQAIALGKRSAVVTTVTGEEYTCDIVSGSSSSSTINCPALLSLVGLKNSAPSNVSRVIATMDNVVTTYGAYGGVLFGDGTTEVSADDYVLGGNIITGIGATANVTSNDNNTVAVYTITNNNAESITISEIARMAKTFYGSSEARYSFLIDRQLLKPPITIEAGGVGQVTYTFEYPIPTA